MKENTCCFSGHRNIEASQKENLKAALKERITALYDRGVTRFAAGGALGFDTLAALSVLEIKEEFEDIELILILPCKNQTKGWRQSDIDLYEKIKGMSDEVVYTSENYFRGCMQVRNRALVDMSDYIICFLKQNSGGTFYTVNYAHKKGLTIYNLAE